MTIAENIDCMKGMARYPDKYFDLAVVDPQTGQGEGKKHISRPKTVKQKSGKILRLQSQHRVKNWDNEPPAASYYAELVRVSKYQIIMCEPRLHFEQKATSAGRIVWNLLRANDFGDCQIMWTNLFQRVEYFEFLWNGMMQGFKVNDRRQQANKKLNEHRTHPSQKPLPVYEHLYTRYAQPGWKILDTHLGSGRSRIAAARLGLDFVGFEIDADIFNDQERSFAEYMLSENNKMFKLETITVNQTKIF